MRTINISKVQSALKKAGIDAVKGPRSARSGQFTPVKPKPLKPSTQTSKQKKIPRNSNTGQFTRSPSSSPDKHDA